MENERSVNRWRALIRGDKRAGRVAFLIVIALTLVAGLVVGGPTSRRAEPNTSTGVAGRTKRDQPNGPSCGQCHGSSASQYVVPSISGPSQVNAGAQASFTLTTQYNVACAGPEGTTACRVGVDIASSDFQGLALNDTGIQISGNEIIHTSTAKTIAIDQTGSVTYNFKYTMPNLIPGSARTLFGVARVGGYGGWNHAANFTAVVPVTTAGPTTVNVTNETSSSLRVSWNGSAAAFYVAYRKNSDGCPSTQNQTIKKLDKVIGANSVTVTGLTASTTYCFTVWAVSELPAGSEPGTDLYSSNSASQTGTTSPPPPSTWPLLQTGSMGTARFAHTATLLANGKVLIAGGQGGAGNPLSSAELYDPATGRFSYTGSMAIARSNHTATPLPNGKVLITGGNATSAVAELYDPVSGTFGNTGTMATTRSGHTATLLNNGKVLVAGGSASVAAADLYDPSNGTFSATGTMVGMRFFHSASLMGNGKVLLAGGSATSGGIPVATAELYDPTSDTFSATNSLTAARKHHTATVLVAGLVRLVGGSDTAGNSLLSTETYDPALDTFEYSSTGGPYATAKHTATVLPSSGVIMISGGRASNGSSLNTMSSEFGSTVTLSEPRISHTATVLAGGRVLITGGNNGTEASPSPTTSADLYDSDVDVRYALSVAGQFYSGGNMTNPRAYHTATLLQDGRVLIAGGINNGTPNDVTQAELYDPATSFTGFVTTGSMSHGRRDHTATLLTDGKVLITGGQSDYSPNYFATADLYDPVSGTFTATGSLGIKRFSHTATLLPNGKVLIAGGSTQSPANIVSAVASAELYDPNSGTFSATGSMAHARQHHTATLLPNGKVLIAGGDDGNGNTLNPSFPELYDPLSGTFTASNAATFYPNARQEHLAVLLPNGKVLFAEGRFCVNSGCSPITSGSGILYDPATDDYGLTSCCVGQTNVPGLNGGRQGFAAAALPDGRVMIVGGFNEGGWLDTAEVYDSTYDWSLKTYNNFNSTGNLTTARFGHTATLLSDYTVLVVGGIGTGSVFLDSAEWFRLWSAPGFNLPQPTITSTPATLFLPAAISITGTGLRAGWDSSSGTSQSSPSDLPLLRLQRVDNDQIVFIRPSARGATNFTSTIQTGLPDGHYRATIIAGGVPSDQSLFVIRTVPLVAPGSLNATASGATSVAVTWSSVTGAATYEIVRSEDNVNYTSRGTVGVTSFNDSAQSSKSYLYKVRAFDALGSFGPDSVKDLATTVLFDDDPLVTGTTIARATHITQLRTAVNSVRTLAGLPGASYAEAITAGSTTIKASHILELRSALDPARSALGLSAVSYADPSLAGGFLIKAAHIADLRSGVK